MHFSHCERKSRVQKPLLQYLNPYTNHVQKCFEMSPFQPYIYEINFSYVRNKIPCSKTTYGKDKRKELLNEPNN